MIYIYRMMMFIYNDIYICICRMVYIYIMIYLMIYIYILLLYQYNGDMMGIHLWSLTINNREFMVVPLIRFAKLECQFHVWVDGRDIKLVTRGQHQPRNSTGGMIYIPFE